MDWSVYSRPLRFEQPYSGATASVGPSSMLWALLTGPLYYWRKGAMIEAILLCASTVPAWVIDENSSYISASTLEEISALIWMGFVAFAPILLALSYKRRGWIAEVERG